MSRAELHFVTETIILHQRYATESHFDHLFSLPPLQPGVQAAGVIESNGAAVSCMMSKRGKRPTAIVTGAASGIGKASAE